MSFRWLLPLSLWLSVSTGAAFAAESYPNRPIRLVVPTGAGGLTDILARIVAEKIRLGQQMIVDNRTGASGIIGSDQECRITSKLKCARK